jgi:hypothetical protein
MYLCDFCQRVAAPGETCATVAMALRERVYSDHNGEPTRGLEIARHGRACPRCVADKLPAPTVRLLEQTPVQVDA